MGGLDILWLGLLCALFFGAIVFYDRTKHSAEKNSKKTFENAKGEAKSIFYLIFGICVFLAIGTMLFGN
jgi:hypothetical protein